jgi:hypothetical protein
LDGGASLCQREAPFTFSFLEIYLPLFFKEGKGEIIFKDEDLYVESLQIVLQA